MPRRAFSTFHSKSLCLALVATLQSLGVQALADMRATVLLDDKNDAPAA